MSAPIQLFFGSALCLAGFSGSFGFSFGIMLGLSIAGGLAVGAAVARLGSGK